MLAGGLPGSPSKGVTSDFDPSRESFHFLPAEGGGIPVRMRVDEMKALFWVRDYLGNRAFESKRECDETAPEDRRAVVTFEDGEEIWGSLDHEELDLGFFLIPVDKRDNNVRIFVVRSALKEMRRVAPPA